MKDDRVSDRQWQDDEQHAAHNSERKAPRSADILSAVRERSARVLAFAFNQQGHRGGDKQGKQHRIRS